MAAAEQHTSRGERLPGWLAQYATIGGDPTDSEDLRVRKTVLVLSATLIASLSFVWVATYALLGLWWSAAIPFVYQLASATSIAIFAATRRYRLFRRSQPVSCCCRSRSRRVVVTRVPLRG